MAQVVSHRDEFEVASTNIVAIAFTANEWQAKAWLEETQAEIPLLLDPQREAYQTYGLGYSLGRAWGPNTLLYYARALLSGSRWRGIQGDSGQLGGDFVIDSGGIVTLAYPSRDPTDRPDVASLLEALG